MRAEKGETKVALEKEYKDKKDADKLEAERKKEVAAYNREVMTRKSFAEREARLQEQLVSGNMRDAGPSSMNADAMARIGGFTGGERAGYDVASTQVSIAKNSLKVQQEIRELQAELVEVLRAQKGERI